MPCFRESTVCTNPSNAELDLSSAKENIDFVTGDPAGVFAHMGWVGYANLVIGGLTGNEGTILRVTSADINLSQDITTPDVIDGRIDKTVYQLGPKIVEGSLSMPVIADVDPTTTGTSGCVNVQDLQTGTSGTLIDHIWCWATARTPHGRLQWADAELQIRYANHSAFRFSKCIANTLSMSVAAEDVVTFDIDVIGEARERYNDPFDNPTISDYLAPARVMTWNDVTITGVGGCDDAKLFGSAQVTSFDFSINNNSSRYYSLNGQLTPIDINVSKREITGSLTLLGLQEALRLRAENQQNEFTRKDEIRVQLFIGEEATSGSRDWFDGGALPETPPGNPIWWNIFTGVIFKIETMGLSLDVFETTIEWIALANDQQNYLAISPGSSCDFPAWT